MTFRLKNQNKESCKWKLDIQFRNLHRMGLHHEVRCPAITWKVRKGVLANRKYSIIETTKTHTFEKILLLKKNWY